MERITSNPKERLTQLNIEAEKLLKKANIPYEKYTLVINTKQHIRFLGRTLYQRKIIEIAKDILEYTSDKVVLSTLCHEYIHTAYPNAGHTGEFKEAANYFNIINYDTGIRIETLATEEERKELHEIPNKYTYAVICKKCGYIHYYNRKPPKNKIIGLLSNEYECRKCGGDNFEIKKL